MNKESTQNVISYRVREFDEYNFWVESYSMKVTDEIDSYVHSNPDYHIRYNSYIKNKQQFLNYIRTKSSYFGYSYEPKQNIDEINAFLATHYFMRGAPNNIEAINRLNELAWEYIEKHNNAIIGLMDPNNHSSSIDGQLHKAYLYLGTGITRIECINVGQANFSVGYDDVNNIPRVIFDIGIKSSVNNNRAYAKGKLKGLGREGIVIISHYDYDHINGYRYLSKDAADRIWILPAKRLSPTPAERNLLSLLKPANCIFLKDIDYANTPFDPASHILTIGNLSIYQGNAKKIDSCQSTSENARCLMCVVKNKKTILLPADCLYEEFPTSFNVDYLVVPHHSCYYDKPIKNMLLPALKELIIFAGPHSGYEHPDISHLNRLNQGGCQVIYLMNHGHYYFNNKNQIPTQAITLVSPSHNVTL